MTSHALSDFPITQRWPAKHPDRIQLYSLPTPNGVKVSILLEELELPYEAHRIDIQVGDQLTPEFISLAPNNRIPALLDPQGPDGAPIAVFESGAILVYLALKAGRLYGDTPRERSEILQWLMWQMGGVGPMFGQLGFFYKFAGKEFEDKRPRDRYAAEARRLLGVLDQRLEGREWLAGEGYSIADIAVLPWVRNLVVNYGASDLVGYSEFAQVQRVLREFLARPAVERGLLVPAAAPN